MPDSHKCHNHSCSGKCVQKQEPYVPNSWTEIGSFRGIDRILVPHYSGTINHGDLRKITSIDPKNAFRNRQAKNVQATSALISLQNKFRAVDKEEMDLIVAEVIYILRARRIISTKEMRRRMKSCDVPNSGHQLYTLARRIIYTDMCNMNQGSVWEMRIIKFKLYSVSPTSAKVWWSGNNEYENGQPRVAMRGGARCFKPQICSFQRPENKYSGVAPVATQTFETMQQLYFLLNSPILGACDFDKAVYDGVMTVLMVGNRLIEEDPYGTPPPEIWKYILSLLLCSDFIANAYNSQYLDIELLMCSKKETKRLYLSIETVERIPGYYSELGPENEAKVSEIVAKELSRDFWRYMWKPKDYSLVTLSVRTALSIESGGYGIHANTPEFDRIELNNYRPTSLCLKGHDLKFTVMETAFGRRYEHFTCNVCLSRFRDCGPFSWWCNECDYDVCTHCTTVEEVDT